MDEMVLTMESGSKYLLHEAILASDTDAVLRLVKQFDLNELDNKGHSPLHWAVFRGDIEIVEILLEAGANPNVMSEDGVTPKWRAKDFELEEIAALLTKFGGRVDTNENFNGIAFKIFNNDILGKPLPENEKDEEK